MKRNIFLTMLVMILTFGMTVVSCGGGGDDNNNNGNGDGTPIASFAGTWNASGGRSIVFTGSNFNYKVNGTTQYSGTFSVSGSTITFNESSLGTASGNFTLSGTTLTLSNHTWDNSVNGAYTKDSGGDGTAPTITTATLPGGTVGTAYSQTLVASGDTPITWSKESGDLPNGLTLSSAGVISGNPTTANTFNFTVKATNAKGNGTKSLSITIASDGGGGNAGTYIITGSGSSFTATKSGATVGTANQTITNVIDAIRTNANGADCTIQFGNLTNVLDIGTAGVSFSGTWGNITLTGKIKSSARSTLSIGSDISANVNSTADIENTDTTADSNHYAISNSGKGTLIIDGGTVSSTGGGWGNAITNSAGCSVIVNGGTVLSTSRRAIVNSGNGTVTINGGTIESQGEGPVINTSSNNSGTINIKGGTVTSTSSVAIRIESGNTLNITNGVVKTTSLSNPAINNFGVATISGGTVSKTITEIGSSWGSGTILNGGTQATLTISGGTVSISSPTGTTTTYSSADAIDNGTTLNITGGTISASGHNARALANQGTATITGGTLTATGSGNVYTVNNIAGATTITSPPTVIDKTKTSGTITWLP